MRQRHHRPSTRGSSSSSRSAKGDRSFFRQLLTAVRKRPWATVKAFAARLTRLLIDRFSENNILTYASAMSVQLLTALVPLALLIFLLMGVLGERSIWQSEMSPRLVGRVSGPVYQAVDSTVTGLLQGGHTGWLVGAVLIVIWEVSGVVRTVMGGLNCILGLEEQRSFWRRFGTSFWLGVLVSVCLLAAFAVTTRGAGWVDLGALQPVWGIGRWLVTLALLWLVVFALFRFAPQDAPPAGWVSAGSVVIIGAWLVISLIWGWWATSVANYTTPFGTMIVLLTMAGYLYASSIVFLVGAQLDKLLREQTTPGKGPFDGVV